jgi:hypothetical protein
MTASPEAQDSPYLPIAGHGLIGDLSAWRETRDAIYEDIMQRG